MMDHTLTGDAWLDSIPTTPFDDLLRSTYRIENLARDAWRTIDPDLQNALIEEAAQMRAMIMDKVREWQHS